MLDSGSTLGPHAKIVALTQGMINQGLQNLYDCYTRLAYLKYEDQELGAISLDLLAPRILIMNETQVYFQFRIQYGRIVHKSLPDVINLEGWTLSHPVNVQALIDLTGPATGPKAGDISIERLFSTLVASANGGLKPDPIYSFRQSKVDAQNKSSLTWQAWTTQSPEEAQWTAKVFDRLPNIYGQAGYNAIGLQILLPPSPSLRSNRLSIGAVNETRSVFDYVAATGAKEDRAQALNFNSILVCSDTGGVDKSKKPPIALEGKLLGSNFVSQAMIDSSEVKNGFWMLSCHDLLETAVLPYLTVMCEASILKTSAPVWTKQPHGEKTYTPVITLGRDFTAKNDDGKPKPGFAFSRTFAQDGCPLYSWNNSDKVAMLQTDDALPGTGKSNRYETSTDCGVQVTWKQTENGNMVRIDVVTNYIVQSQWASGANWASIIGTLRYTYCIKYYFFVKFELVEEDMKITLTNCPHDVSDPEKGGLRIEPVNVEFTPDYADFEPECMQPVEKFINTSLVNSIKIASQKAQTLFADTMKFPIDPDSAYVQFVAGPIFNVTGDLVAGIQYKLPQFSSKFLTAYVPPAPDIIKPNPEITKPKPKDTPILTWTGAFTKTPALGTGRLVVTGKNEGTSDDAWIGYLQITFTSGLKGADFLFSAPSIKTNQVTVVQIEGKATLLVTQNPTDKKWTVRLNPKADEGEEPGAAVFRMRPGTSIEVAIEANSKAQVGSIAEVGVREAWKDDGDLTNYKGEGETLLQVRVDSSG